jgi:hypothetical protein
MLVEEMGPDRGMRQMRKHTGWYLTGFPVGGARRRELAQVSTMADLDAQLDDLDPDLELPDSARRIPRGHTNGPVPVSLPTGWLDNLDDPTPPQGDGALVAGG